MRIAILASNIIRIPPRPKDVPRGGSGATEEVVSRITEGLVKKGHKVTLFASGDSRTAAKIVSVNRIPSAKDPNIGIGPHEMYEYLLISKAYQMAQKNNFDIVHSHYDIKSAYYAPLSRIPTVSTLHSPLERIKGILKFFKNTQYYVSISNAQRKSFPDLNYIATIYHGLDPKTYPFSEQGGDYLLYVGRIDPNKGTDTAIRVAMNSGKRIILLGWAKKKHMKFYTEKIKPWIDGKKVTNHGFISRKSLKEYLKNAKALIFPIRWEEPFGLVLIEAMACGTPVVAFKRGSVPEIVEDGKTGYIVNPSENDVRGEWIIKKTGTEGLVQAIRRIYEMSETEYIKMRLACRERVIEFFSIEKMINQYEGVYKKITSSF